MAKNPKTKRTQIKDLSNGEQGITAREMKTVKGGKEEKKPVVVDPKTGNQFEYTLLPSDTTVLPKMDMPDTQLQITPITTPKKK